VWTTVYTPVALTEATDVANAVDQNGDPANCFSSLSVGSNTSLTLPAGTFYINGGDAFVQGNLTATDGTTIVLTNKDDADDATIGQFKVNADANVNITSPTSTSDPFRGIAIYQDRRAVDSSSANNKINGNSASKIVGTLYFPNQELDYNGTGNTVAVCTRFVTRRVVFSGNGSVKNQFEKNCPGAGLDPIEGGRRVRLVS